MERTRIIAWLTARLHDLRKPAPHMPSRDRLGTVFASLDTQQVWSCFVAWAAELAGPPGFGLDLPSPDGPA